MTLRTQAPITIYAAGPIDLGKDIPDWRSKLINLLDGSGFVAVLFDPSTAYKNSVWGEPNAARSLYIEQLNKQALEMSNTFVACLPRNVPSVGTPIEVEFADKSDGVERKYILTDIPRGKSVYLDNRFSEESWIFIEDMSDAGQISNALYKLADKIIHATMKKQAEFTDS